MSVRALFTAGFGVLARATDVPLLGGISPDLPGLSNDVWLLQASMGTPEQPLSLLFDTGSDITWSWQVNPACGSASPPFAPNGSSTAAQLPGSIDTVYGAGRVTGHNFEDEIRLGDRIVRLPMGLVDMSGIPDVGCFDGLLGADMESTFFLALFSRAGISPMLGVLGSAPERAQAMLAVGEEALTEASRFVQGGMACVPTVPVGQRTSSGVSSGSKYWQVAVAGVSVGGGAVAVPAGLQAIADTGTGSITGSHATIGSMLSAIGAPSSGDCDGIEVFPDLTFHLHGGVDLVFGAAEYVAHIDGRCRLLLESMDGIHDDWLVLGANLWWKYYTLLDFRGRMGFGLAKGAEGAPFESTCGDLSHTDEVGELLARTPPELTTVWAFAALCGAAVVFLTWRLRPAASTADDAAGFQALAES